MLKFTKFDLEPKWVDSSICFCGGGGGGMGEGQDNTGIADAAGYGSGSGTSGGMNEGQDNTGIADAAGYGSGSGTSGGSAQAGDTTSSDAETDDPATAGAGSTEAGYSDATGQMGTPGSGLGGYQGSTGPGFGGYAGGPGANEQAVSYAGPPDMTAEQKAAISKAFVTNTKGMPISTPNSKGKFGGYLGKTNATDKDISGALAALAGIPGTPESKAAGAAATAAASGAPVGIASSPSISAAEVLGISPVESMARFGTPGYAGMTAQAATNTADQFSTPATAPSARAPSVNVSNVLSAVNDLAAQSLASSQGKPGAPSTGIASVAVDSLDRSNPNAMAAAEKAEVGQLLGALSSDVRSGPVSDTQIGITAAPAVSAQEVLSGLPDELSTPAMSSASVSAPASNVANPNAPGQLSSAEMAALDALAARGFDQNTAQMGLRADDLTSSQVDENVAANIGYDPVTDMPYGLEFATNPQTGAPISTNLAGLTEQQKANQPFSMDVAQFIGSNPYGYEIDPVTGQVIGQVGSPPFGILGNLTTGLQNLFMGPPQNTQDLIERGAYTGMTGQGGDGMTGGDGAGVDSVAQQPTTDPCPEGYALVGGACTPVSPEEEAAFKFGTDTGVKYFDPFTQATQLGGMNPFVLQPYMPGQNPFAQPSQTPASTGIQALSPTGAALGRQV